MKISMPWKTTHSGKIEPKKRLNSFFSSVKVFHELHGLQRVHGVISELFRLSGELQAVSEESNTVASGVPV